MVIKTNDNQGGHSSLLSLKESKADQQKLIDYVGEDTAKLFFSMKDRLKSPENDIYYWLKKSPKELEDRLSEIQSIKTRKEKDEESSQGAELIYKDSDWKVYHITTYEASVKYGKSTKWCIAGSKGWEVHGRDQFNNYVSRGDNIYFYLNKSIGSFAIICNFENWTYQVFNSANVDITQRKLSFLPNVEKLPTFNLSEDGSFLYNGFDIPNYLIFKVTNLYVSDTLTSIKDYAFCDNEVLEEITVFNNVKNIGTGIFEGCYNVIIYTNNPIMINYCKENNIFWKPLSKTESLTEASRKDLRTQSQRGSPKRYAKRLNYYVSNFKGVDLAQLFEHDYFVFNTPIKDYICTLAFPGVLTKLRDNVKSTNGDPKRINLRMVIQALREAFDATDDVKVRCTCPDFCLTGDTEIKLLEGKSIKMEDLLKEFESGRQDLRAYSVDEVTHDFRPGHISDVWISGYSDELIEVTLDNDKVIKTTPNHLYMLRDGTYKRADELTVGQSLMTCQSNFHDMMCDLGYGNYNHSVKSIRHIKLEKPIPVYDLTVDKYSNFLVSAGVILHNCYRFMHYAWKYNYLYGDPTPGTEEPPNITNPDNAIGATCKHLDLFLANKRWLTKAASTVNALIHTYPDKAATYLYDEDEIQEDEPEEDEVETEVEEDTEEEVSSDEEVEETEETEEE